MAGTTNVYYAKQIAVKSDSDTIQILDIEATVQKAAEGKTDKTAITTSSSTTATLTMSNNTEVRYGEVTHLELVLPSNIPNDYISSAVFTSGSPAADVDFDGGTTNFVYPSTIKMSGENCSGGVFTPMANKRYTVILTYDGVYVSGIVGGVSI